MNKLHPEITLEAFLEFIKIQSQKKQCNENNL